MSTNTLLIIFLAIIFTRTLDVLEVGFLFLLRALGIIWFDYDWYDSFHEWYKRTGQKLRQKEEQRKKEEEEANCLMIIDEEIDE